MPLGQHQHGKNIKTFPLQSRDSLPDTDWIPQKKLLSKSAASSPVNLTVQTQSLKTSSKNLSPQFRKAEKSTNVSAKVSQQASVQERDATSFGLQKNKHEATKHASSQHEVQISMDNSVSNSTVPPVNERHVEGI